MTFRFPVSLLATALGLLTLCAPLRADQVSFSPLTGTLLNPERGFYDFIPLDSSANFTQCRNNGFTLVYTPIALNAYLTSAIDQTRLDEITAALGRMRTAGVKGIVRVTYSDDIGEPDADLAHVELHLQQLQPIFEANKDVIAFFQAGFIGAWGEWHSSTNGLDTPTGRQDVWDLLLTYLPQNTFIQIRTPGYVNELESMDLYPLNDATAFANNGPARIAHHNDCFLADDTDMGTYPSPGAEQDALKAQLAHDTLYVPWGGETCKQSPLAECSNALDELEQFHATFLNAVYHPAVINDFTTGGCYTTIDEKLGYRFELTTATLPSIITRGEDFDVSIQLKNVGWAPVYNARPVYLRLMADGAVAAEYELSADPRFWRPESGVITISQTLTAPASGTFTAATLALWLPDANTSLRSRSAYAIRMANTGVWDSSLGHNVLAGNIPVQDAALSPTRMKMDGLFDDWEGIDPLIVDPAGDSGAAVADYLALYVANDENYIYLRIQTSGAVDLDASGLCNIFIDTDQNAATGYSALGATLGSEMLIQAGQGYAQRGGGFNEGNITALGYLQMPAGGGTDVEIRLSRAATFADASPVFGESGLNLLLESENSSWATEELAPDSGPPAQYTMDSNFVPVALASLTLD